MKITDLICACWTVYCSPAGCACPSVCSNSHGFDFRGVYQINAMFKNRAIRFAFLVMPTTAKGLFSRSGLRFPQVRKSERLAEGGSSGSGSGGEEGKEGQGSSGT